MHSKRRMRNGIVAVAMASVASSSISPPSSASSPSAIRGGGGVTMTTIDNTGTNKKKKRTRHDILRRRPGIVDADQSNKIRLWKEQWLASASGAVQGADETSMEEDEEGGAETATMMMQRQRQLEPKSNISASQFGNISVKAAPADILGFQKPPSLPTVAEVDDKVVDETSDITTQTPSTTSVTTSTTTTTAATTTPANKYYPLYLFDFTKGTCTNNGHEPSEYCYTIQHSQLHVYYQVRML